MFRNLIQGEGALDIVWLSSEYMMIELISRGSLVAVSPDAQRMASGAGDNTIRLWDTATGQQVGDPLMGHTDWVCSVAFSPDGKHIASGSGNHTIRLWTTATGEQVKKPFRGAIPCASRAASCAPSFLALLLSTNVEKLLLDFVSAEGGVIVADNVVLQIIYVVPGVPPPSWLRWKGLMWKQATSYMRFGTRARARRGRRRRYVVAQWVRAWRGPLQALRELAKEPVPLGCGASLLGYGTCETLTTTRIYLSSIDYPHHSCRFQWLSYHPGNGGQFLFGRTLLEGHVKISNANDGILMRPGRQFE
ncbi:WD40-repeat-containing domain protein [Mycena leptocephala]|nr:WD40-repeat-containing domain protein [Mycena leptocephala]